MKVLAFLDYYLPGFKAGGPLPAVSRTVDLLGSEIQFFIVTRDRDLTDREAYRDVAADTWTVVGKALVYYTNDLSFANLRHRVLDVRPDVVYLNSFFSRFTAKVLLMRRVK